MLRGNHVIEPYRTKFVWRRQWDVGGKANLSQPHANNGRCRKREVEGEDGKKGQVDEECISGCGVS